MTKTAFTLTDLLDLAEKSAVDGLVDRQMKSIMPTFHLISPDRKHDTLVATPWDGDMEKRLAVTKVRQMAREMKATAVCFSSEVWMLVLPPGVDYAPDRPSQSPNRIEGVIIVATDGKETKARSLLTIRDKPGGKVLRLDRDPKVPDDDGSQYDSWMLEDIIMLAKRPKPYIPDGDKYP